MASKDLLSNGNVPGNDDIDRMCNMRSKFFSNSMTHRLVATIASLIQVKFLRENLSTNPHPGIPHEDYVRREEHLATLDLAKKGTTWCLVPAHAPASTDIRSSIRLFTIPALIYENGQFEEIDSTYATGSSTPIVYRKQGNASALTASIVDHLTKYHNGLNKQHLAFLFSKAESLFKPYFEKSIGVECFIPMLHTFPETIPTQNQLQRRFLKLIDMESILATETQRLRADMQKSATKSNNLPQFVIIPTKAAVEYRFVASKMNMEITGLGKGKDLDVMGVALYEDSDFGVGKEVALCIWRSGSMDRILYLDLIRASTTAQLQQLLECAREVAQSWDLTNKLIWRGGRNYCDMFDQLGVENFHSSSPFYMWISAERGERKKAEWREPQGYSAAPNFLQYH